MTSISVCNVLLHRKKMSIKKEFLEKGYAIITNFLTLDEINELKNAGKQFPYEAIKNENIAIFGSTSSEPAPQCLDRYFIDSADKISYFYEKEAISVNGVLQCSPEIALNKVGHALHWLHPTFKKITFHEKVKKVCKDLGLRKPVVVQSMYIYKNPKIGAEVKIHQDSSYIFTKPIKLYGFWFALDDATEENGCLQAIPQSHDTEVTRRFIRNPDKNCDELCIHVGIEKKYDDNQFKTLSVKGGSCILIHGQLVHRSAHNSSDIPRHAYTFHVVDIHECDYAKENWLQTEFHSLYDN